MDGGVLLVVVLENVKGLREGMEVRTGVLG